MSSNSETDVDYGKVVVELTSRVRVIECKMSMQWILQERSKAAVTKPTRGCYYSKKFVRTRAGIVFAAKQLGIDIGAEITKLLESILPERI